MFIHILNIEVIKLEKKKRTNYTMNMIKVGSHLDKEVFYEFRVKYFNAILNELVPPEQQTAVIQRLINDGYIADN